MPRKKGDGERALLRRSGGKYARLTEPQWKELEKIIGVVLPIEARKQINFANRAFSMFGPYHSPKSTILVREILPLIQAWLISTNKLQQKLGVPRPAKGHIATKIGLLTVYLDENTVERITKMLPLQLLTFTIQSALDAGEIALNDLQEKERNGPLKNDMWAAWVCFIAIILSDLDVKISASSSNKTIHDSPFVSVIENLQARLPRKCRRFRGYESITKGVQKARRTMGSFDKRVLLTILAGWGSDFLKKGYPGNLTKQTSEAVANFAIAARERLESLRVAKEEPVDPDEGTDI